MKLCELNVGKRMRITSLDTDEREVKMLVGRGFAPGALVCALMRRGDCGIYFADGAYYAVSDSIGSRITGEPL